MANYYYPKYYVGSGVDFNFNPFNITINAGGTEGRGNISVVSDNTVEGLETFNIGLTLVTNSPQITLGRVISEGLITDSTSEHIILVYSIMSKK